MKIDSCFEMLAITKTISYLPDSLYLGIKSFTNRIGDPVLEVSQNLPQIFAEHPGYLDHRFKTRVGGPEIPSLEIRGGNTDTCNASWAGQKTTQLSGNLHGIGDNFLVVFHVFENSGPSREVYVDFGLVTTVP